MLKRWKQGSATRNFSLTYYEIQEEATLRAEKTQKFRF